MGACAFTDIHDASDAVKCICCAAVSSETKLGLNEEVVDGIREAAFEDSGEELVKGVKERDGAVVVEKFGVALFKDEDNTCL